MEPAEEIQRLEKEVKCLNEKVRILTLKMELKNNYLAETISMLEDLDKHMAIMDRGKLGMKVAIAELIRRLKLSL